MSDLGLVCTKNRMVSCHYFVVRRFVWLVIPGSLTGGVPHLSLMIAYEDGYDVIGYDAEMLSGRTRRRSVPIADGEPPVPVLRRTGRSQHSRGRTIPYRGGNGLIIGPGGTQTTQPLESLALKRSGAIGLFSARNRGRIVGCSPRLHRLLQV
jgi:hypothetical protein